uniref:Nuclear protein localization protein 4 homolog n=1 Tax=Simocephalus serrulatus TaxID=117539 RepID=A0A4Y7NNZ0_9CRUS|nr:EOG090X05T8 [Simocephalus serrulatus]SVE94224.1 EOG090X05T8 [Simocephalus serrulatus]
MVFRICYSNPVVKDSSHRMSIDSQFTTFGYEMSMLRIQSPEGTRRVEVENNTCTKELFEKVLGVFELTGYTFALYCKRDKSQEIISSKEKTVATYGLKHGDMVYLWSLAGSSTPSEPSGNVKNGVTTTASSSSSFGSSSSSIAGSKIPTRSNVEEDQVDVILQKMKGTVKRKRDPKKQLVLTITCLHGDNSSCIHCLPLEPYDPSYLKELNVKHMSFHAYLRKLSSGLDGGKYANLENISCRIKPGCTNHPPWPKSVCSKCQPKAITLNSQPYRHVDNVVFENPNLVERFLHYWRATGRQRMGFLYGRFDVHLDVPLGIKGIVAAIYEPPQESTRDSIRLLPDSRQSVVDRLASKLGLACIGWIFTDLVTEDATKGTVRHFRNAETHFLSAQECITAGHLQSLHPNPCRLSAEGYFGSKFVTICVTGDSENQVHMEGYQVSNQCQALVRDECIVPTKDAPELAYVRQSTAEKYIPDVYYKVSERFLCVCLAIRLRVKWESSMSTATVYVYFSIQVFFPSNIPR